jgi:hypothetical protein
MNCGASMGCSCQRRVASDGKACCGSCISAYELNLQKKITVTPKPSSTAPTNVNVFYKAP